MLEKFNRTGAEMADILINVERAKDIFRRFSLRCLAKS
jgi:hypothetical protein